MLCGRFWYEDAREKYCAARLYVNDVVVYMVAGPERSRAPGLLLFSGTEQCYSIFLTASPPPPPNPQENPTLLLVAQCN